MARLPGPAEQLPFPRAGTQVQRLPQNPKNAALVGMGRQVSSLENELFQAFEKEAERISRVEAEDFINSAINYSIELSDGDDGFKQYKGGDAVKKPLLKDYTARFQDWYDNKTKDMDARTMEKVKPRFDLRKSQLAQDIMQHQTHENEVWQKNTTAATLASSQQIAATHPYSVGTIESELARGKAAIIEWADAQGMADSKEFVDMEYRKFASDVYVSVISRAIDDGKTGYAKTLLEQHKDVIDPDKANTLRSAMKLSDTLGYAQGQSDRIMAMNISDTEKLAEARKISDPKKRKATVDLVKERINETNTLDKRAEEQLVEDAWGLLYSAETMNAIPPTVMDKLPGDVLVRMKDWVSAKQKSRIEERKVDDYVVLDNVQTMIESGDITDPEQLYPYAPYLTKKSYGALRTQIQKAGDVSPTSVKDAYEWRSGSKRADKPEEWRAFQDYINAHVKEMKRPDDLDIWADKWFMEGYAINSLWYKNDPNTYGEAVMAGKTDMFVIDAPERDVPNVQESIQILKRNEFKVQEGDTAVDEFYTKYYFEAERWLRAHGSAVTPRLVAAYAYLRADKKAITPANVNWVAGQLQ